LGGKINDALHTVFGPWPRLGPAIDYSDEAIIMVRTGTRRAAAGHCSGYPCVRINLNAASFAARVYSTEELYCTSRLKAAGLELMQPGTT